MGLREMLVIFLGIGLIGFFTYQRVLRALFFIFILWAATLMSALVYESAALRMKALLANRPLAEGGFFLFFLTFFCVVGYTLVYKAFPETHLPKLGILDNTLGFFCGVLIAFIVVSLVMNAVGVMVHEQWTVNKQGWLNLYTSYQGSILRPYTNQFIRVYQLTYFPFFNPMPPILTPQ